MKCPICGNIITNIADFCNICRTELNTVFLSQESRNQWLVCNRERWEKETIAHGSCGSNSNWVLKKNGQLLITGSGNIDDMEKRVETEFIDVWDDWFDVCYKYSYPEYDANGHYIEPPKEHQYITVEHKIDTVPWGTYRNEIKSVDIAPGITGIGDNAFLDCTNLSSVHLPDTVTKIGKSSFQNCDHLTIKRLPSHLTYLGDNAFVHKDGYSGCLTSNIPSGLTYIGDNAFYAREGNNLSIEYLPDAITKIGKSSFQNCDHLTIKRLPSHLTYLGDNAFVHSDGYSGCLTSNIPSGLTYIGDNAFYAREGNKNIGIIALSDQLTYIGKNAFRGCFNMSLQSKYLPHTLCSKPYMYLKTISQNAFGGCWNLRQIVLPDDLHAIEEFAFADCHNLTEVKLPDTLQRIGDSAFSECRSLQEIELPETIYDIGNHAFKNCVNLQKIVFQGEFPEKNAHNCYVDWDGRVVKHDAEYLPFAGVGCVHIYCKASGNDSWKNLTLDNWGAKKIYWHRVD